jgi:hypothetical protein
MLACSSPDTMGSLAERCLHCGQGTSRVAMRCPSSWCLRCATVAVANWMSQVSQRLHAGVLERHIILTVPAMCRTTFDHNAALGGSACMRCGAPCLDDVYRTVRDRPLRGGSMTMLHTHGRHGSTPSAKDVLQRDGRAAPHRGHACQRGAKHMGRGMSRAFLGATTMPCGGMCDMW